MKETLTIKNFGPIEDITLELKKLNVLIGEQASGKSTIAKVLKMCRYFSYIVNYISFHRIKHPEEDTNGYFGLGLSEWGLSGFLKNDTRISYENDIYEFKVNAVNNTKTVSSLLKPKNERLKLVLKDLYNLLDEEIKNNKVSNYLWHPNENFYRISVKKVMDNPYYIPAERAYESFFTTERALTPDMIRRELDKLNRISRNFQDETLIEPLGLYYKNINNIGYIREKDKKDFYKLYESASGYQTAIPIVLVIKYYSQMKRKKTFIIEEPENNLFPMAQKKLMEFIVSSINEYGHSFLIPTHSSYLLSTIENFIYAYKIGTLYKENNKEKIPKIIDKKYWINPDDVSAYYLDDGKVKNLLLNDKGEGCYINIDDLDNVSKSIIDEYDALLDAKMEMKRKKEKV